MEQQSLDDRTYTVYNMVYWIYEAQFWDLLLRKKYIPFKTLIIHLITQELWQRCTIKLTLFSRLLTQIHPAVYGLGVILNFKYSQLRSTVCKALTAKLSKPGFNNTWTVNFQMFKLVLEKAEEPKIKLPTSAGSSKKQESSRKTSISALLTMPKPLIVWITISCGKFWKRWEYQITWPASWETYMQVRKQQLELDMEQQTGSK